MFGYENELVFPIYVSDQKFEDSVDLLLDIDKHLFIEKGQRGGISYIAKRCTKEIIKSWMIMILKNRQNL